MVANLNTKEEIQKKVLYSNTHFTCGNYYYQIWHILMSRMWDIIMSHNYYSLDETLHFITIVCKSFVFLAHWDAGNDCVICCQHNHIVPYLEIRCYSHMVIHTGESKCYFGFIAVELELLLTSELFNIWSVLPTQCVAVLVILGDRTFVGLKIVGT